MARSDRGCYRCVLTAGLAAFLALALIAALGGCTTPAVTACPPIVAYDQPTMAAAAAELADLPDGSPLAAMMGDYKRERAELRACAGH